MGEKLGPAFNRLFRASVISNLSDGLLAVAAPLLAISLTKDPILISLLSAFVMLPWLLFAIPIGLIVGGIAATAIAVSAFRFVYELGNLTSQGDYAESSATA